MCDLPDVTDALCGMNTMTVFPIVVVKSRNPYTVCVICESGEIASDEAMATGFSYAKSGLTYTGPGGESPLAGLSMDTEKKQNTDDDGRRQRNRITIITSVRKYNVSNVPGTFWG